MKFAIALLVFGVAGFVAADDDPPTATYENIIGDTPSGSDPEPLPTQTGDHTCFDNCALRCNFKVVLFYPMPFWKKGFKKCRGKCEKKCDNKFSGMADGGVEDDGVEDGVGGVDDVEIEAKVKEALAEAKLALGMD